MELMWCLVLLVAQFGPQPFILKRDTAVRLLVKEAISSANLSAGSKIEFEVAEDVIVRGEILIYRSAPAWGIADLDTKAAGMITRGVIVINRFEAEAADGQKVPLEGRVIRVGKSNCGGDACVFRPILQPWKTEGESILRPGTKFYLSVSSDTELRPAPKQPYMKTGELPNAAAEVTVFRCTAESANKRIGLTFDNEDFVTIGEGETLTITVPDGKHKVAYDGGWPTKKSDRRIVSFDSAFGTHHYVQVLERSARLTLVENDECADRATVVPIDWNYVGKKWRR